jgi:hypothetical protein
MKIRKESFLSGIAAFPLKVYFLVNVEDYLFLKVIGKPNWALITFELSPVYFLGHDSV